MGPHTMHAVISFRWFPATTSGIIAAPCPLPFLNTEASDCRQKPYRVRSHISTVTPRKIYFLLIAHWEIRHIIDTDLSL